MEHEIRPWGEFWVLLEEKTYKLKKIMVNPNQRLSYQYHHKRSEVWTVINGTATVTIDDITQEYEIGDVIKIPLGAKHRLENKTNLICEIIEVQLGTYFGEDDIVRK